MFLFLVTNFELCGFQLQLTFHSDFDDDGTIQEKDGYETVDIEGQQVGIKTSSIEEKCRAFEMLVVHCSTMGVKFAPWLPQILQLVVPGLSFIFHDGVREAAALYVILCLTQ